ncbi:MAG TPA: hypothetical protein VF912_08205 [Anaeromyxobacter sp.]
MPAPLLAVSLLASALSAVGGSAAAAGRAEVRPARAEVAALVRRCVAAYGGKGALTRAAVTKQEGRVTSLLHPGVDGRIVRGYARPGRLRVEIVFPGSPPEIRVLDGGRGWRNGEEVESARLASMLLQAARLDLPALLAAWEKKIEDRGTGDADGTPVRVLALEPAPGIVVEAAIDVRTALVVRSRGSSRDPGMPLEFVTTYGDFRKVDGVIVAFHEKNWANGRSTGETVLEKVEFPKALPDAAFRP